MNNICGKDRNKFKTQFMRRTLNKIVGRTRAPRLYQIACQNRDGYFRNACCTYNQFGFGGQRETKTRLCNRFARADVPANCTITGIETGWIHSHDGSRKWEYKLEATPLNELFYKEANYYIERSSLKVE